MKTNTKKKLRDFSNQELEKRYHYLKSKQSPKVESDSLQMKYIRYHLRKRGINV